MSTPAAKFKEFCDKRGLSCELVPRYSTDQRKGGKRPRKTPRTRLRGLHTRRVKLNGELVSVRTLSKHGIYYSLSGTSAEIVTEFVAFSIPDDPEHWLILPRSEISCDTTFSLAPDLDRETKTRRHHWASFVDNLQQLHNANQN